MRETGQMTPEFERLFAMRRTLFLQYPPGTTFGQIGADLAKRFPGLPLVDAVKCVTQTKH
jgi:hypothetical protein